MTAKPSKLIARPTYRTGTVTVNGPDMLGRPLQVTVERWATDLLDTEAWAAHLGNGRPPEWHTTPGSACATVLRRYCIAGHGTPPVTPAQMQRPAIAPTTSTIADRIHAPGDRTPA